MQRSRTVVPVPTCVTAGGRPVHVSLPEAITGEIQYVKRCLTSGCVATPLTPLRVSDSHGPHSPFVPFGACVADCPGSGGHTPSSVAEALSQYMPLRSPFTAAAYACLLARSLSVAFL